MNAQQRKLMRPETVKKNILGTIRAIRGTKKNITRLTSAKAIEAHHSQIRSYVKNLKKLLSERKLNGWTN